MSDRPAWDDQFREDEDEKRQRQRETRDMNAYLKLFEPNTYGVEIPRQLAKKMEAKGWVEWVPPVFGNTPIYAITDLGRKIAAESI